MTEEVVLLLHLIACLKLLRDISGRNTVPDIQERNYR